MLNSPTLLVLDFPCESFNFCIDVELNPITANSSMWMFISHIHGKSLSLVMLCGIQSTLSITHTAMLVSFCLVLPGVSFPCALISTCPSFKEFILSIATYTPGFCFSLFLPFQIDWSLSSFFSLCFPGGYTWFFKIILVVILKIITWLIDSAQSKVNHSLYFLLT